MKMVEVVNESKPDVSGRVRFSGYRVVDEDGVALHEELYTSIPGDPPPARMMEWARRICERYMREPWCFRNTMGEYNVDEDDVGYYDAFTADDGNGGMC